METLRASTYQTMPKLRTYAATTAKVFRGEDEEAQLKSLLGDSELISDCSSLITAAQETTFDERQQAGRLLALDYLSDSLAWSDNPASQAVQQAFVDLLLDDNWQVDRPLLLRRSLFGDKAELYLALRATYPVLADRVKKLADGTRQGRAIAFAERRLDFLSTDQNTLPAKGN